MTLETQGASLQSITLFLILATHLSCQTGTLDILVESSINPRVHSLSTVKADASTLSGLSSIRLHLFSAAQIREIVSFSDDVSSFLVICTQTWSNLPKSHRHSLLQ